MARGSWTIIPEGRWFREYVACDHGWARWRDAAAGLHHGIQIRGYYIPWGDKRIHCQSIRSIRRVNMGALTGRARLWGTANPRYWAHLDLLRPRKKVAFILDTGHVVCPFLTPDDPDAFESALTAHCDVTVQRGGRSIII